MQKKALGRGLAAIMPDADQESVSVEVIPISKIAANPYQPRTQFDVVALADLELSIKEHGVLQPILVHKVGDNAFQLVAGERRLRAARNSGLQEIPALVKTYTTKEMIETALVENVQRENISAMEAAKSYQRMITEFGMTQEIISQRVGKSRSSIANTLRLLTLPVKIQQSIETGEISEGHGRAILTADSREAMMRVWEMTCKRKLSVREAERMARETKSPTSQEIDSGIRMKSELPSTNNLPGGSTVPNPFTMRIVEDLEQIFQTRVNLKWNGSGAGRLEIEFYSDEELERILEFLSTIQVK